MMVLVLLVQAERAISVVAKRRSREASRKTVVMLVGSVRGCRR